MTTAETHDNGQIWQPSEVWERWLAARSSEPGLTPEAFCADLGEDAAQVLIVLGTMLDLERGAIPAPLIDTVGPGPDDSGRVFAGFRIVRNIGQGTSGIVFLAIDERDGAGGREVALKVLNPLLSADPARRDSILREAEIARKLDHPGIVRALASGIERGYAWIATEWVDGETLDRLIGRQGGAGERARFATSIGLQLAGALAHAHAQGVVHRDLKPANLIVGAGEILRVLDFGLARSDGTAFAMSRTGEAIGTPLYMAPEQARGEDVGPAADVYAVGLILYELASGERLTSERNLPSLLARIAAGRFRVSRAWMQRVDPRLRPVISRCLEAHPEDRYPSCGDLEGALLDLQQGGAPRIGALSVTRRWLRRSRRHPLRASAAVLGLSAVMWLGTVTWWNWPMPVYIETQLGGKVLWIDGEVLGIEPQTIRLLPGKHTWKARFGEREFWYEAEFEVAHRHARYLTLVLDPGYGVPRLDVLPDLPNVGFAWIQVSTPLREIDLTINGVRNQGVPGIVATRVPYGRYTVIVEANGRRKYERTIDVTTPDLCMLTLDPDPVDSPWHTLLLYSPIERIVQEGLLEIQGLQTYFEKEAIDGNKPIYVNRSYWGPSSNFEDGTALFAVDLPVSPGELEIELCLNTWKEQQGAHIRLQMGASPEDLLDVFDEHSMRGEGGVQEPSRVSAIDHGMYYRIPEDRVALLVERLKAGRRLFIRCTTGGVIAGSSCAYAQVLHSHGLPYWTEQDELVWSPAIRLMVKE